MNNNQNPINSSEENKIIRFESFIGLKEIHRHWGWFLGIGLGLILLGIIAVSASVLFTLASMIFFGVILLIGGIIQGINAFKTRKGGGFLVNALSAILYVIVGLLLIMHPAIGAITLTLLIAVVFTISGLFRIIAALSHRYAHWGWMLFNGIITLALGLMIWAQWPVSGLWVIGLFIGIDLIIAGWIWVTLALSSRNLEIKE